MAQEYFLISSLAWLLQCWLNIIFNLGEFVLQQLILKYNIFILYFCTGLDYLPTSENPHGTSSYFVSFQTCDYRESKEPYLIAVNETIKLACATQQAASVEVSTTLISSLKIIFKWLDACHNGRYKLTWKELLLLGYTKCPTWHNSGTFVFYLIPLSFEICSSELWYTPLWMPPFSHQTTNALSPAL